MKEGHKYKRAKSLKMRKLTDVPASFFDRSFWRRASLFELIYAMTGLFLGLICIIGGILLFLRGVTGSTSWVANFMGSQSQTSDAAPGAILFFVGLFIVWVTRYRIRIRK